MSTFKVVLLGDGGVGKTTLLKRVLNGEFEKRYIATLGVEVHPLRFFSPNKNKNVCLNIWDCAGQEKFGGLRDCYYIQSHALIAMFDLTSFVTFKNLIRWIENYRRMCNTPIILVGTKCDLGNRKVSEVEINFLKEKYNCTYFEISSKIDYQCDLPFLELANTL
jgi:GTP-binding nuclear protein Ran